MDILSIGVGVDTKDLVRGIRELEKFGKSANKASEQTDVATKSMARMGIVVTRLAGFLGSVGLAKTLVQVSDQYTKLNAQLSISARTQDDYSKSLQDVIRISNLAQTSLDGTATLYARLSNTLKDTNVTQQQFANITESVALGLRVSGATTAEAQSAMLQLSQAFAAGVLRGEEFNAVSEASFPLMKALADSMGIPIEQLRSMAMEGKITRDELVKAFSDPALIESFKTQAKELNTVGGAFQVLQNNLSLVIGEINETTGASSALAESLTHLASSSAIRLPFEALAVLGVNLAFIFNQVSNEISGIGSQIIALSKLDFKEFGNIRQTMIKDAKDARIEVDRISEAILNPTAKQRSKSLNNEALSLNTNLATATAKTKKLTEAEKEYQRILDNRKSATLEIQDLKTITGLVQSGLDIEEAQFRVASARKGLLPAQIEALLTQKNIQDDIAVAEVERQSRLQFFIKTQQKAHDDEVQRIKEIIKLQQEKANENFKQAQDAQKEIETQNQRMAENLNRSLTDALLRGFESGLSFAENFRRTLRNMFSTLVLQPIISFALQPITNVATGIMSQILGTGSAGASGIGNTASTLGGIGNLFQNVNTSIVSGVASFGQALTNFGATGSSFLTNTASQLGSFVQLNQQLIAKALPFLDAGIKLLSGDVKGAAFSGGGAAIGFKIGGPLGAAIGSALGNVLGGILGGKKQPPRTVTELPDVAEVFNQQLSALLQGFNGAGNVSSTASFTGRAGGSGYGGFSGMVEDMAISDSIRYKDAFNDASLQAFITRTLTETLTRAIKSTDIDKAFKDLFDGITDREEMGKTIQAVIALNQNNQQLTDTLGITATQVALLANESDIAGDNLVTLVNTLTGISTELLTTGDALVAIKAGIDGAFVALSGSEVPANLKAFDEALKALDKTTAEGRQDFLGLVAIRQTFAEFETAIAGLRGSVRGALFSIVDDGERLTMMQADLAKMFADVNLQVPASVSELKELINSIDFTTAAGINLASVMPSLANAFNQTQDAAEQARVALENQAESARIALENIARTQMQQIINSANELNRIAQDNLQEANRNVDIARDNLMNSFDAERTRLQGIIDSVGSLRENLATAFNAERSRLQGVIDSVATLKENLVTVFAAEKDRLKLIIDNVDTFKSALRQAFDAKASGLQDTISKFKDFGKTIRDFRKGLLQTSPVVSDPLGFNRAKFLETASLAKAGDTAAMDELTLVASDFLESSENYSKDFNQFQSDFLEVNRILADVENSTFASASVAELQLDLLKQQVSSLINLDENILSVDDAIANLNKAQTEANVAQAQIKHLNELQTRLLGENNESLVSVQDAVDNLVNAQTQAHEAQNEIKRLNELQTHFLGASNESLMSVDAQLQNLLNAQTLALQAQTNLNALNNQQINLLGVINESVLSVATAIAGFNVARQAQSTAQTAATSAQGQLAQVQQSQSNADTVLTPESIYEQFLGRKPDPEGLAYWKSQFGATVDTSELRIFQEAVRANQALGLEQTDEALIFAQQKFANGASFTNGIVSRPTTFNTGMMGESGSEAIMPLSNVGGRLGVTSNNSEMVAQLKAISEKITRLEAVQVATAQNTGKVAKIIERADNGESINVTVTA